MVIDSSAVIAIAFGEPEGRALLRALAADPVRLMSAVNAPEARRSLPDDGDPQRSEPWIA